MKITQCCNYGVLYIVVVTLREVFFTTAWKYFYGVAVDLEHIKRLFLIMYITIRILVCFFLNCNTLFTSVNVNGLFLYVNLYGLTEKRVCIEVELALQQRMSHKWSILKNSKDKQQLEKFLNEIIVSFAFD